MVPRAIAEGLTGGRSAKICLSIVGTSDHHSRRLVECKRERYVKGGVVQETLVVQQGLLVRRLDGQNSDERLKGLRRHGGRTSLRKKGMLTSIDVFQAVQTSVGME